MPFMVETMGAFEIEVRQPLRIMYEASSSWSGFPLFLSHQIP